MGRTQRALTSLVAAIPAGFLSYLLVMVFLNQADSLKMAMQVVVGATLLASIVVTLMPFVLLIPGRKKALANAGPAAGSASDDEDAVDVMDDDAEISEDVEVEEEASATSDFDLDDSDANVMADSDVNVGNASSLDDMDAFDKDDEEEEKPKPKKRKK